MEPRLLPHVPTDASSRDAALLYLAAGLHPVPVCRPEPSSPSGCTAAWHGQLPAHAERGVGKTPLLGRTPLDGRPGLGALKLAETKGVTAAELRRMPWDGSNVAICPEPSGLAVLDLDGAAARAEAMRLGLTRTAMVRRGDHAHCYYRLPAGVPATRAIGQGRSRGIDLLAAGYVLAPPSVHASAEAYTLAVEAPFAPLPDWAAEWLRKADRRRGPERGLGDQRLDPSAGEDLLWSYHLPAWLLARIRAGDQSGDRSRTDWSVTRVLVEHGVPDGVIAAIYRNPAWRIGAKYRQRADPDRYLTAMLARHHAALRERGTER